MSSSTMGTGRSSSRNRATGEAVQRLRPIRRLLNPERDGVTVALGVFGAEARRDHSFGQEIAQKIARFSDFRCPSPFP